MPRFNHLIELFDENLINQQLLETHLNDLRREIRSTINRFGANNQLVETLMTVNIILQSIAVSKLLSMQ